MDIHNTSEDIVFGTANKVFEEIQKSNNPDKYCLCEQCQVDTICYTLNRIEPHYITSNRGLTRVQQNGVKRQQNEADVTTLLYKGLRLVNHNMRPTASHDGSAFQERKIKQPFFDVPTISGRIFDGISFEPIVGTDISLVCEGELVQMRNNNWLNPYTIIPSTPGAYSFWPIPIPTDVPDLEKIFHFSLKVNSPDYEILNHFFSIIIVSKFHNPNSYALNRTYKLPDLYLFPPGEAEQNEDS
jgi:competence protein ComFB